MQGLSPISEAEKVVPDREIFYWNSALLNEGTLPERYDSLGKGVQILRLAFCTHAD